MALDTAFFSLFPDIYEVGGFEQPVVELKFENLEQDAVESKAEAKPVVPKDFDCLRFLIETFERKCMPLNEYGLGHIKYLV